MLIVFCLGRPYRGLLGSTFPDELLRYRKTFKVPRIAQSGRPEIKSSTNSLLLTPIFHLFKIRYLPSC